MRLSDEQRAAVDAGPVDLFISAGAGSGKTRVLTARFVHAVLGVSPYDRMSPRAILAITFTERAAGELSERIRGALIGENAAEQARRVEDAWISTIHGMCSKILRQHAFDAGLDPRFRVASEVEAGMLAHEAIEEVLRMAIHAGDEGTARLLDAMGFGELASAVFSLHGDIRSMGKDASEVITIGSADRGARIHAVVGEIERTRALIASTCRVQLKTVTDNLERLKYASEFGRALAITSDTAEPTLCELAAAKRLRGDDEHNDLVDHANRAIDELTLLYAQQLVVPFEKALLRVLSAFADTYANLKAERSLLDFEDLQVLVARLLETHPSISQEYRERFRMIMIDEFQDTNELQLKIARYLAAEDLCTVGDDKQSIYSFRHADVKVFRDRENAVTHMQRLADNYRSHPDLLSFFNGLFGDQALFGSDFAHLQPGAHDRSDDAWPESRSRARVVFVEAQKESGLTAIEAEAVAIAEEFASLRDEGFYQGDMVLLLRKMTDAAEVFERELKRRGFDVFIASGGTFFDTPEVREVIALLRLVDNAFDDEAAVTVLAGRFTRASDDALFVLKEAAGRKGGLWPNTRAYADLPLTDADASVIARTVTAVEQMRSRRGSASLHELILETCEALDYDLVLLAGSEHGARAWANVMKLARLAEEFERSNHGDVGSFLDYLSLRDEHIASEQQATVAGERAKAVRIMSVHAAKGLEFPIVGVASISGATPGPRGTIVAPHDGSLLLGMRLPLPEGSKSSTAETTAHRLLVDQVTTTTTEETKRLLYVACTRAERALVLCLRDDLGKEPSGTSPPALVRQALGYTEHGPDRDEIARLKNGACVDVAILRPVEEASQQDEGSRVPSCGQPPLLPPTTNRAEPMTAAPAVISYSALALYERCPYRFYIERLAGLPLPARESQPDHSEAHRDFGSAVHEALRGFCIRGEVGPASLQAIASAYGLAGRDVIRLHAAADAFTTSALGNEVHSAERMIAECPINVPLGHSILVGSIDVIAWRGDEALIVDYKTGRGELSVEDARERYRLQAACYALAALRAGAAAVRVVFFEPERGGRQTTFAFEAGETTVVEASLLEILGAMDAGRFEPLEAYDRFICGECAALGSLCPVTPNVAG